MAMPSHTPMVLTCSGVPPAMRTPALTASAICCRWIWPGMTSFCADTTATSGAFEFLVGEAVGFQKTSVGRSRQPLLDGIASQLHPFPFAIRGCGYQDAKARERPCEDACDGGCPARAYLLARVAGIARAPSSRSAWLLEGVFPTARCGFSRCPLAVVRSSGTRPVVAFPKLFEYLARRMRSQGRNMHETL